MACPEVNPCDPCNEYDNCGCLNPTTFGCVTTNKVRECLGTESGEDGESILDKIEENICNIGKVMLDADDTCPEYLSEKITAGLNIDISYSGTGCDRQMVISATEGGVPVDVNAKVSADDTTSGYLYDKIQTGTYLTKSIVSPAGNEKLKLDVAPATLISSELGNQLGLGSDGKLVTLYTAPDGSETKVIAGTGTTVSGSGTVVDPYILSTNASIQVTRPCFDNTWRPITLVATGNPSVTYLSGAPEYRYRFDGTIEFRGALTYQVAFGNNVSASRKFTVTVGNIPVTCVTLGEQAGIIDLKSITYIESAGQMYNYIVRKSTQNIVLEFQSSFTAATTKTIVVNFEGAVSYPLI